MTRTALSRSPVSFLIIILLALLLCTAGCGKKKGGTRGLNPYFRGREYVNTYKDYRLDLPGIAWRYEKVAGWDLSFRHNEFPAQVFVDSSWFTLTRSLDKAARAWFDKFHLQVAELTSEPLPELATPRGIVHGMRFRGSGHIRVNRSPKYTVERQFQCEVYRRGQRFFFILYEAPAASFAKLQPDFAAFSTSFWPMEAKKP